MLEWRELPLLPPFDEDGESDYLLLLQARAVCPVAGYYDANREAFYMLGCAGAGPLDRVTAWARIPPLPARLYRDPVWREYARAGGLIEEGDE